MAWTNILNSSLLPGKPVRSIDALALRDNPIAIAEGAANAPIVQHRATANFIEANTTYAASENDFIFCDTTGAGFTVTLPAAPNNFQKITIVDEKGTFGSNWLSVGRNGKTIMGLAEDMTIDKDNATVTLVYINNDWRLI